MAGLFRLFPQAQIWEPFVIYTSVACYDWATRARLQNATKNNGSIKYAIPRVVLLYNNRITWCEQGAHNSQSNTHVWHERSFHLTIQLKLTTRCTPGVQYTAERCMIDDANNQNAYAHNFTKSKYKRALSTLWQQVDAMGRRPVLLPTNCVHPNKTSETARLDSIHHHWFRVYGTKEATDADH